MAEPKFLYVVMAPGRGDIVAYDGRHEHHRASVPGDGGRVEFGRGVITCFPSEAFPFVRQSRDGGRAFHLSSHPLRDTRFQNGSTAVGTDGTLAAGDWSSINSKPGGHVWVRREGTGAWRRHRVPDWFCPEGLSVGEDGAVSVCGTNITRQKPGANRGAALLRVEPDGRVEDVRVALAWRSAIRAWMLMTPMADFGRFEAVSSETEPTVLFGGAWYLSDGSMAGPSGRYCLVRAGRVWHLKFAPFETSRECVSREWPGTVSIYWHCTRHRTGDGGRRWIGDGLGPALREAVRPALGDQELSIHFADARGPEMVVGVAFPVPAEGEIPWRSAYAILTSSDDGATFRLCTLLKDGSQRLAGLALDRCD